MGSSLARLITQVESISNHQVYGRVSSVLGMLVEVSGINQLLSIGSECSIQTNSGKTVKCEVVGFNTNNAKVLPFGTFVPLHIREITHEGGDFLIAPHRNLQRHGAKHGFELWERPGPPFRRAHLAKNRART